MRRMIQHHAVAQAFEKLTVGGTATGLTAATYANKQGCFITVEDASIRYRFDGTDPDASNGHLVAPGGFIELIHPTALSRLSFISLAGNATLQVSYY